MIEVRYGFGIEVIVLDDEVAELLHQEGEKLEVMPNGEEKNAAAVEFALAIISAHPIEIKDLNRFEACREVKDEDEDPCSGYHGCN